VDILVVDKTGTLTEGRPSVTRVVPVDGFDADQLLRLAAGVERASEHPLALAIVEAAERRVERLPDVADFDAPAGRGAAGVVEGSRVAVGSARFLDGLGVDTSALTDEADALRREGATVVLAAVDGRPAGVFAVADPVKQSTPDALAALRADGIRIVMLTGDNRATAEAVARGLGIDEIEAEVLPDRKSDVVARLRADGRVVARRWRPPMSASPWARALTSRSRARG
jgi:Cu+-exporting ATPase